jgi:cellulose synthase/poly-beta-1,6-N-acetylglucosamine synthase-like glycosyltransferase
MSSIEVIFWMCIAALAWTWMGYPFFMTARAALARPDQGASGGGGHRRHPSAADLPAVTLILAVRNGAAELEQRVANLLEQDYPQERLDVIIACNGCTDLTEQVAARLASQSERVSVVVSPGQHGKAGALNAAAAEARGELLAFADLRQRFDPRAIAELVLGLSDPRTGCVTGRLVVGSASAGMVRGVGRYWELETRLRMAESQSGSLVGVSGAIYAIRRELFRPLPPGLILDDVYLPMTAARAGFRVGMIPSAVAYDRPSPDGAAEYRRRVRTLVGNLELIRVMPGLLSPAGNPVFVRFVSHKLLRVLTPGFCLALTISGLLATGLGYRAAAWGILLVYLAGLVGVLRPSRLLAVPSAFLLLHAAGFSAMSRPFRGAADLWS